jgi:hypothetical protein
MPKRKSNDKKYMEALAILEDRITKLEARPFVSGGVVAKLNLSPGDMMVVKSKDRIDINVLKELAKGVTDSMGFPVSVVHVEGDRSVGVFKKAML